MSDSDDRDDDALQDADEHDGAGGDRRDDELVAAQPPDPLHPGDVDQLDADEEHDRRRAPPRACTAAAR